MKLKTEFEPYINTIVNKLQEKGVNIQIDNNDEYYARALTSYVDLSLPMFFSEYFGPMLYEQLISSLYETLGTEHVYIIKDDISIETKYIREKLPITGEEVEYIRIFFKFIISQC